MFGWSTAIVIAAVQRVYFRQDSDWHGPTFVANVKRRAATSWSGSGATEAEVLIFDSLTQDVIAAAKDSKTTGLKEKFTKWGAAEDAFQFWASRLKRFLDQAHGLTIK